MNDDTTNVTIRCGSKRYVNADLVKMDPVPLRALFRERVHHTINAPGIRFAATAHLRRTAERFHSKYKLPDYMGVAMHIAVGWGATGIIKSGRLPLSEMIMSKDES